MRHNKENMKAELRAAVETVMNRYRVNGHLSFYKAVHEVSEELKSMKHVKRGGKFTLITDSEFLATLEKNKKRRTPKALFWWLK